MACCTPWRRIASRLFTTFATRIAARLRKADEAVRLRSLFLPGSTIPSRGKARWLDAARAKWAHRRPHEHAFAPSAMSRLTVTMAPARATGSRRRRHRCPWQRWRHCRQSVGRPPAWARRVPRAKLDVDGYQYAPVSRCRVLDTRMDDRRNARCPTGTTGRRRKR